ncbi:MAG: hypothetical protein ACOC36_05480 [Fibrobacterota bacterium]
MHKALFRLGTALWVMMFFFAAEAQDSLAHLFSRTSLYSTVSQSLAGAGTALPAGGMQGLLNPALPFSYKYEVKGNRGSLVLGYGRDPVFEKIGLPMGLAFADEEGAMAFYYRYLNGKPGSVHASTFNMSGRLFEQVDKQGPVDFGMNIRYEGSRWNGLSNDTAADVRSGSEQCRSVVIDLGFYQPYVMPNFDFSLVVRNVTGYLWEEEKVQGEEDRKSDGWVGGRHRTVILGGLYTMSFARDNVRVLIPLDLEMTNLLDKKTGTKYIFRTGMEARITPLYSLRLGYARAPENPLDLVKDFDYRNLFFGGGGVYVKPLQIDFFIGEDEWGITTTYDY